MRQLHVRSATQHGTATAGQATAAARQATAAPPALWRGVPLFCPPSCPSSKANGDMFNLHASGLLITHIEAVRHRKSGYRGAIQCWSTHERKERLQKNAAGRRRSVAPDVLACRSNGQRGEGLRWEAGSAACWGGLPQAGTARNPVRCTVHLRKPEACHACGTTAPNAQPSPAKSTAHSTSSSTNQRSPARRPHPSARSAGCCPPPRWPPPTRPARSTQSRRSWRCARRG